MPNQQNLHFKYDYMDGFSGRLLGIELSVDDKFHYTLEEEAFSKPDGYDAPFFIKVQGLLPIKIKSLLQQIYAIHNLANEIRADYTIEGFRRDDGVNVSITDLPSYIFLFFINGKTIRVDGDGTYLFNDSQSVTEDYQLTEAERLLHQIWQELESWTTYIYTTFITQQFS